MDKCETCEWYETYVDGQGEYIYGVCRRFPPTAQRDYGNNPIKAIYEIQTTFPRPEKDDWCGEYKTIKESK